MQADGCSCAGTPSGGDDCDGISISTANGKITITGLTAAIEIVKVFNANWQEVDGCTANCGDMQMYDVPAGTYYVSVKFFTATWSPICEIQETVTVTNGGDPCAGQGGDSDNDGVCNNQDCQPFNPNFPATPGTSCNDGNPNTVNDVVQADGCSCAGTTTNPCAGQGGDSDNDGVCNNQDCQPFNPNFPATPGTSCNDGNPNTVNDVVQADGCSCAGTPSGGDDCDGITVNAGTGKITVSGLSAPIVLVKIFDSNWNIVFNKNGCDPTEIVTGLAPGQYVVEVQFYTASWQPICTRTLNITIHQAFAAAQTPYVTLHARSRANRVELEWINNSGQRNDLYRIERSVDGVEFEPLHYRDAYQAEGVLQREYFTDEQPLFGELHYRVRLTLKDGTEIVSSPALVNFTPAQYALYPVPARDVCYLDLSAFAGKTVQVQLVDQYGKTVLTHRAVPTTGQTERIELHDTVNGMYFIMLQTEGRRLEAGRLVVLRPY